MKFTKPFILFLTLFIVLFTSCKKEKNYTSKNTNNTLEADYLKYWKKVDSYYLNQIQLASSLIDSLNQSDLNTNQKKYYFEKIRIAFKKAEPYAGALNTETTHRANGPALPIYNEDSGRIIAPVGLQKLEEDIYEEGCSDDEFRRDLHIQKGLLEGLSKNIKKRDLNAQRFFIATHQQLMRLVSLSIVGFDTPISHLSIGECSISLNSLLYVYENSIQSIILSQNKILDLSFQKNIESAVRYVEKNTDFETFDRFVFIRDYLNPITTNWVEIRKTSGLWDGKTNGSPFNFNAPTFFAKDAFNDDFFAKTNNRAPSKEMIALGKKLFFDKNISSSGNMSCASCHVPEKAYTDGLQFSPNNIGKPSKRNTPTLLNSSYQKALFWDGSAENLEAQITGVFTNKDEFDTNTHQFSSEILKDSTYVDDFKTVFGKVPTKNIAVIRAISSFVATLKSLDSKFDKNIRKEENTFTESEISGFNLFTGKALCATCHFIPLTNGTVPPFFKETEKEIIGVPKTSHNKELDTDVGFYKIYNEEAHKGMFKTPTVRNISKTAPYMHNGAYNTLEEVLDFYNQGGGKGLGFDVPHQTLPFDNLDLSEKEIKDIIAFLKTLSDQ
ncbi:MAG: cytochrome c peroxidase [Flavicella sp.]|nr:cytochrome c peroxidase [Flavicella sp.]